MCFLVCTSSTSSTNLVVNLQPRKPPPLRRPQKFVSPSLYPALPPHHGAQQLTPLPTTTEGRLQAPTLSLLAGSDIQFRRDARLDIALVKNHNLALVFLPAADIPTFVGEGRVDLGITGRDQVAEHEALSPPTATTGVEEVLDLGFGKCKLQVQVPAKGRIREAAELVGANVVTSFVGLTGEYFARLEGKDGGAGGEAHAGLSTKIKYVGGSVEAACALGVADGIVDLVGKVFFGNGKVERGAKGGYVGTRVRRDDESGGSHGH